MSDDSVVIRVVGSDLVARRFAQANSGIRQRLTALIMREAEALRAKVVSEQLSGGPGTKKAGGAVARRTGRLARSMTAKLFQSKDGSKIEARVYPHGTRAPYAWPLMLGPSGRQVTVSGYTRRVSSRDMQRYVATRQLKSRTNVALRRVSSGIAFVSAYRRTPRWEKRPFMDRPYFSSRDAIRERLVDAINQEIVALEAEANGFSGGEGI